MNNGLKATIIRLNKETNLVTLRDIGTNEPYSQSTGKYIYVLPFKGIYNIYIHSNKVVDYHTWYEVQDYEDLRN